MYCQWVARSAGARPGWNTSELDSSRAKWAGSTLAALDWGKPLLSMARKKHCEDLDYNVLEYKQSYEV